MYATHLPEDPTTCYVFEVYADDDAYQVHAASPQFQGYVAMASAALNARLAELEKWADVSKTTDFDAPRP